MPWVPWGSGGDTQGLPNTPGAVPHSPDTANMVIALSQILMMVVFYVAIMIAVIIKYNTLTITIGHSLNTTSHWLHRRFVT
jgi:hypothetical protein